MEVNKQLGVQAVFFDFMGTCLNWHKSILAALPAAIPENNRSTLALEWRQLFFDEILHRSRSKLPFEDIDETHRRTLATLLDQYPRFQDDFTTAAREHAIKAWHAMEAWPEVAEALRQLQNRYEIFVLANGTTRLQLDLVRSSGLSFDLLFSSELLGVSKPEPEIYLKCMELVRKSPEKCVMVAAHAYDLRAAKTVGMRTVYIRRWTEDLREDMDLIKEENDAVLESFAGIQACVDSL